MRTRMKISLFQRSFASWAIQDNAVYVCSFARTPIGKLSGSLSSQTAPRLGAHAIKAAIERANIEINVIEEILMGNVVSAGTMGSILNKLSHLLLVPDLSRWIYLHSYSIRIIIYYLIILCLLVRYRTSSGPTSCRVCRPSSTCILYHHQ